MKTATLGLYSVDPPALDAFHSFDPESFVALLAISDALIAIGPEGEVKPSLAVSWERTSPVTMEMELREGVSFHNGEPFDADSVVATHHHHLHPTPSACGGGILSPIVQVEKLAPFRIRLTTAFPDAMLLRRLFFFSIYPKGVLEAQGRDAMLHHPIGTGAFRFVHWHKGEEILLARNPDHFSGGAKVDQVRIPILRQKEWVERLGRGELDMALNIDSHDAVRAARLPGVEVASREAALSQWFLLASHGPLADVQVRRALNHAIKRSLIAEVSEHGLAKPQRTVATQESFGHTDDATPYRYSPELAKRMLAEAGYPDGFTLSGLVSETSTGVYFAVREFLGRIGVTLEAEIVPRSQWIGRVVGGNLTGNSYAGDFAVSIVDNPLLDSIFHQYIFCFSEGVFSLSRDPAYDQQFLKAATTVGEDGLAARQELERYATDQAMVLFTVEQQIHAAWRDGCHVPMPVSGHFDSYFWWQFSVPDFVRPSLEPAPVSEMEDVRALVEATSHTGTFFLPPGHEFSEPWAEHLWNSLQTSERRWRLAHEPMIKELVTQIEARNNLSSILSSTQRVAIVGYSIEGAKRFGNAGFDRMFSTEMDHVADVLVSPTWQSIADAVEEEGSWLGPISLDPGKLPGGAASQLYLTATPSLDDEGAHTGLTLVFSDFSGEEERIKNQAIRAILDNVPYGLFMVEADGTLRSGYSDACRELFGGAETIEGERLADLIGLDEREGLGLHMGIEQVFDDWMPEEVTLGQLPARVAADGRFLSLSASIVRDTHGAIDGLLFTCADISELIEAEREVEAMQGTLSVLRYRDRFEAYVHEFAANIAELEAAPQAAEWEVRARRELHTAKGVFGQFGLGTLQRTYHVLEDAPEVGVAQLRQARTALQVVLDQHADIWGVTLQGGADHFEVADDQLSDLQAKMDAVTTIEAAQALVRQHIAAVRTKPAAQVLGPIGDSVRQLAQRRGKNVDVQVRGLEHRLPVQLAPVFDQLGHLVRNAVDHGIEAPECRGDKPARATVAIEVVRGEDAWSVLVTDDGRGIDADQVAEKAISLGVVSAETVAGYTDAQKHKLLFVDGLSTADSVSDTSGRGVGMAAVLAAVEAVGGTVQIRSVITEGTRFELTLPDPASAVAMA